MTEEIKLRSNRKNLTGQKFGKLTVIKPVKTINDTSRWLCKCECGNEKIVATYRLLSGRVKTCGDCFNTINFYIPEIRRLEQENNSLQAQLNNITVQSNNAITALEQENKELKELNKKICEDCSKEIKVYWNALEEIRDYLYTLTTADSDFVNTETYLRINDKIEEVLNENKQN